MALGQCSQHWIFFVIYEWVSNARKIVCQNQVRRCIERRIQGNKIKNVICDSVLYASCSEKSFCQNILLFQILVWWITISDWPLLLVCISFYSPLGMFQNILLAEYHGTFHDTPLARIFIRLLANLQNKFEWGGDDVSNLCLHINWCRWLLC